MRFAIVLALLSLAACDKSPTAANDTFLATAFSAPQAFKTGTTASVIVGITNVTDRPQIYNENFCGPAFDVFSSDGTSLMGVRPCLDVFVARTLAPGAQAMYASEWTAVRVDSLGRTVPLAPGTYTIRPVPIIGFTPVTVTNAPFTITVTP